MAIFFSGYGLGRQFTHHHEVTAANSTTKTQDSEREPTEGTRHLVSITLGQDVLGKWNPFKVSGKLPTYPSPNSLTPTSHLGRNVGIGEV